MTNRPHNPRPELAILQALLEHPDDYVSGSVLADRLGMSRVAVWQHLEKLRGQGFNFDAARARGYRLSGRPRHLSPLLIEAHLRGRGATFGFEACETVDSTNDEASRLLAAGRATPFVVTALSQTKGRGRFGRVWHSEDNGNLYLSFAFRPELPPERMQTFTLWMGVNVCELVAAHTAVPPQLKWPNDILFDGRKAGGMLTEARIDADQIRDLVFGLGLNLQGPGPTRVFPAEVARRAASVSEHARGRLDPNEFAADVIARVAQAYNQFIDGKYRDSFADLWNKFDCLRGHPVSLLHGAERIDGTAVGVDDEGSLIVRTARGRLERFRAGEVTLSKRTP